MATQYLRSGTSSRTPITNIRTNMTRNQLARIISALMRQGMTRDEAIAHMNGRYVVEKEDK